MSWYYSYTWNTEVNIQDRARIQPGAAQTHGNPLSETLLLLRGVAHRPLPNIQDKGNTTRSVNLIRVQANAPVQMSCVQHNGRAMKVERAEDSKQATGAHTSKIAERRCAVSRTPQQDVGKISNQATAAPSAKAHFMAACHSSSLVSSSFSSSSSSYVDAPRAVQVTTRVTNSKLKRKANKRQDRLHHWRQGASL